MSQNSSSFNSLKAQLLQAEIPGFPASWYYFGCTRNAKSRILNNDIGDFRLMALKSKKGEWQVLQRNCLHMGADLSKGKFTEKGLRCPMHGWQYSEQGMLEHKGKCLHRFPTIERNSQLFVFLGAESNFYPFPIESSNPLLFPKSPLRFSIQIPWFLLSANGFDINHFETVHERVFTSIPQVQESPDYVFRVLHQFRNAGTRLPNKLLRALLGEAMELDYSVFRGNCIYAISSAGQMKNHMFFLIHPNPSGAEVFLFPLSSPGSLGSLPVLSFFFNPIRNYFIRRFFQDEIDSIHELSFMQDSLEETDLMFMQFIHWIQKQAHAANK